MLTGSQRAAWTHTAHLMAVTLNIWRDPKKSKPIDPDKLNPYLVRGAKRQKLQGSIQDLKVLLNSTKQSKYGSKHGKH